VAHQQYLTIHAVLGSKDFPLTCINVSKGNYSLFPQDLRNMLLTYMNVAAHLDKMLWNSKKHYYQR